ncbi:MAG: hypothetical protein ACI8RD_012611, partial [Bacillariaceae sp.]
VVLVLFVTTKAINNVQLCDKLIFKNNNNNNNNN